MTDAPRLLGVAVAEPGERWVAAGFAVRDDRVRLGPVEVRTGVDTPGALPALVFDRPHPLGATSLDGIAWTVDTTAGTGSGAPHTNGIDGIDHVVVMAPDLDRVRSALVDAGFEIRRERPTTMGDTKITQLFAWSGGVVLEVVAPTEQPADAPPDGPRGAAELWGLALVAPDLDATATWFGERCSPPKPAVQRGRRIATVRHRDLGLSTTIAVMSPHADAVAGG